MEAGKGMDEITENNDINWNQMFVDEIGTEYFFFCLLFFFYLLFLLLLV